MAWFKKTFATPGLRKWFFNRAGYNRIGLFTDDMLYEDDVVKEAIRRIPPEAYDARLFRLVRAHQLTVQQTILPKEEWVKFEDDQKNRYLMPYIEQVQKELKERKMWVKMH